MRRLITISLFLVLIAVLTTSSCFAAAKVQSFAMDIPGLGLTATSTDLVVGYANWLVDCTGGTSLSATDNIADLIGLYGSKPGKVWTFEYQDTTGWHTLTNLVNSSQALPTADSTIVSENAGTFTVYAKAFHIAYNVDFTGADAAASGTAGITVNAVPEPSSMIALATGVVGLLGLIKRRRS